MRTLLKFSPHLCYQSSPATRNRAEVPSAMLRHARYSCHWEFPSWSQFSCYTGDNTESSPHLLVKWHCCRVGADIYPKEHRVFTAWSLLWVKFLDYAGMWLFLGLGKLSCGQATAVQLLSVHLLIYYHYKYQESHLKETHPTQDG